MRERIGTAQHSDDLSEAKTGDLGDVDIIRACGMAGAHSPLSLSIWRWRVGGDRREIFAVARGLIEMGQDPQLVHRVLAHLADDLCRPCKGRGYDTVPGTPMLSDEICGHCHGTGRVPVKHDQERELVEVIAKLEREFAAAVMRKLARQIEL